jgi:hypothetical protein
MTTQSGTTVNRSTSRDPSRPWLLAALLLATAASLLLLFLPLVATSETGTEGERTAGTTSSIESRDEQQSLVESAGWGVAGVLAVPVLICAAPLLFSGRRRRVATITAAVLLTTGVVVGAASVGLFYLPSAVLIVVAAVKTRALRQ